MELYLIALGVLGAVFGLIALRLYIQKKRICKKYSPVIDIDGEVAKAKAELSKLIDDHIRQEKDWQRRLEELGSQYTKSKQLFDRLTSEVSLLEEKL